jgi:hypothetical protein
MVHEGHLADSGDTQVRKCPGRVALLLGRAYVLPHI